ncbi:unnamed protein product [[Candida] boidinii]|nr:unnamed protein product [[Candida] boidinii]
MKEENLRRIIGSLVIEYDQLIDIVMRFHWRSIDRSEIDEILSGTKDFPTDGSKCKGQHTTFREVHKCYFNVSEVIVRFILKECCPLCLVLDEPSPNSATSSPIKSNKKPSIPDSGSFLNGSKPSMESKTQYKRLSSRKENSSDKLGEKLVLANKHNGLNQSPLKVIIKKGKLNKIQAVENRDRFGVRSSASSKTDNISSQLDGRYYMNEPTDNLHSSNGVMASPTAVHDDNVIGSITRSKSGYGSASLSDRFRSPSPSLQIGSSSSTVDSNDFISRLPDNNNTFSTVILSLIDLSEYPSNSDIAKRNSKGKWQEIEYNFVLRVTDESTRFNFLFPLPDNSPSGIVELLNVWFITLRRPNKIIYKLAADSAFDTIDLKLQKKLVNELKKYLGSCFIVSDEDSDNDEQMEEKEDEFMNDLKSLQIF